MSKNAYRLPDYLEHILLACRKIRQFSAALSESEFATNELVQDAVVRNIEIVGEAVINIRRSAPEFIAAHPELPWGDICDMRNQLAHGYRRLTSRSFGTRFKKTFPCWKRRFASCTGKFA